MRKFIYPLCLILLSQAQAEVVSVNGAGSTFAAPLYAKWIAAYNDENVKIDYQAIGSGGGIKGTTDRTVDFAGTDAPLTDAQMKALPNRVLHIPIVGEAIVMAYNLPGVTDLVLNGEVIAKIYLGQITKWNDAAIAALNPKAVLPNLNIVVAHRTDGSGTTFIFTDYLSKISNNWKKTVGCAISVKWPIGLGGRG